MGKDLSRRKNTANTGIGQEMRSVPGKAAFYFAPGSTISDQCVHAYGAISINSMAQEKLREKGYVSSPVSVSFSGVLSDLVKYGACGVYVLNVFCSMSRT